MKFKQLLCYSNEALRQDREQTRDLVKSENTMAQCQNSIQYAAKKANLNERYFLILMT